MRRLWRDWFYAGLLLILPLLLFASVSVGNKTLLPADALYLSEPYRSGVDVGQVQNPLLADLILENYAWKQFLVDAVSSQTLPLWNPYLFTGHTFLANGQHSALYPLTWIFFLLPVARAFGLFTVLQLGMAGISMYVLSRVIRANRTGALVAGIVFVCLLALIPAVSYFGAIPAMLMMAVLGWLDFIASRTLNKLADSTQRATILSVKGLTFNLGYGAISIAFASLVAWQSTIKPTADEAFLGALPYQPVYFLVVMAAFFLFIGLRRKKES